MIIHCGAEDLTGKYLIENVKCSIRTYQALLIKVI